MTFLVFFSIFIFSMLVWIGCEFRATEHYETQLQYRVDIISLSTMLIGFAGSLLASIVQSVHGIG
jgi:hypothetical protein